MKRVVSILLATVMLFSVFAVSTISAGALTVKEAEDNVDYVWAYIDRYGFLNEAGNHAIQSTYKGDNGICTTTIVADVESSNLLFLLSCETEYNEYWADFYYCTPGDDIYVAVYDDNGTLDSYAYINPISLTSLSDYYFTKKGGTVGESDMQAVSNVLLQLLLMESEFLLEDECDITLQELGFVSYSVSDCDHSNTTLKNKKSATYFAKGYSGDKYCKDCNTLIKKGKKTPVVKLKKPSVKVTGGKKKFTVKYSKVKDATGFQVWYKCSGKTVSEKFKTSKAVTKSISGKKGSYTVKVRAYITKSGKTAYSDYTKAVKVSVK